MFGRVFVAFWASSLVIVVAMMLLSLALGSRPLLFTWLTHSMDLYARTATDLYEHSGNVLLDQYLADISANSGIDGAFFGPDGEQLSQRAPVAKTEDVLARARSAGKTAYDMRNWSVAVVVAGRHGNYLFAAHVHPWRRRQIAFAPGAALSRALVAMGIAAILCLIMARYLTKPIRDLQSVARRIASGDLKARVAPLLRSRNDELGELATDFDLMADRVQGLIERQQTLLSDISHELRSPLARLNLSAELVRRGDASAAGRMKADIKRLEDLISELLTLSRIEASERNTRRDRVNLAQMVKQIIQDAAFEGRPLGKDILQTGADEIFVYADANLLQRCIENVVRNAVRYTPPSTAVEVNLESNSSGITSSVSIRVIDEGPGVPTEALPHLFEPFYRVSQSRERDGGAGLGLAISQRIAHLHGGEISAGNRPEGGFEVSMILPTGRSE
jgi:two-component system sensor histidine kinase CpxA